VSSRGKQAVTEVILLMKNILNLKIAVLTFWEVNVLGVDILKLTHGWRITDTAIY